MSNNFYKNRKTDEIWWLDDADSIGEFLFSFDKDQIFNLFSDYPWKLTQKQIERFNKENPEWAKFFSNRLGEDGR